jgi:hypothetical protein
MINKFGLFWGFLALFLLAFPAEAAVKVDWETNAYYDHSNSGSTSSWNTGFQTTGDWSLGDNGAFFLRDKLVKDSNASNWAGTLDRCYLQYQKGPYRVNLGRQAVIWGVGWIFRPTDVITPQQSFKQDDTRPGEDLVTFNWATSPLTAFDLVAGDQVAAFRTEWRLNQTNLRVLGLSLPDDQKMVGFDFQGGLAGLYGEACYKWSDSFDTGKPAVMLGWKKTLSSGELLFLEGYHDESAGKQSLYTGRNYFGAGMEIPWNELTVFDLMAVYNSDKSEMTYTGIVRLQMSDNLDLNGSLLVMPDSQVVLQLQSKYYF